MSTGLGEFPLSYLSAAGTRADRILPLTWYLLWVAVAVCIIIAALLWIAVCRNPSAAASRTESPQSIKEVSLVRGTDPVRWITLGVSISAIPLIIALVWTMVALASTSGPPSNPALVLDVTGHQWWWEVRYDSAEPAQVFLTANEIHIPVGETVLVRLHGGDVIHSFWVPKLTGKTDTIPGQVNFSWIRADRPGLYRGQCTEYCGYQHAHMSLEVIAEPHAAFDQWRAAQLASAPAPATPDQERGRQLVEYRCGLCHQVRGTLAGAISAPDLTHIASRRTLAAGTLLNNPGNLSGWIEDPQAVKPGALMPNQFLSAQELADVRAYLETLQ
jgi:cytochrome c oxidase subunit II